MSRTFYSILNFFTTGILILILQSAYGQSVKELDSTWSALDTTVHNLKDLEIVLNYASSWRRGPAYMTSHRAYLAQLRKTFMMHPEAEIRGMADRLLILDRIIAAIEYKQQYDFSKCGHELDGVIRMARSRKDTVMQYLCLRQFQRLYESLEDTVNQLKSGYEAYQLALDYGDSTYGMLGLLDLVRIEPDSLKMRDVIKASDKYFEKEINNEGIYAYTRGWALTGRGYFLEALPDLLEADSLMRKEDVGYWPAVLWTTSESYYGLGEYQLAINVLNEGVDYIIKQNEPLYWWAAGMTVSIGENQLALGRYFEAEHSFRTAIDYARLGNSLHNEEAALKYLKDLLLRGARYEEYSKAIELWVNLKDSLDKIDAGSDLARLNFRLQQFTDSVNFANDKAALSKKISEEETRGNIFLLFTLGFSIFGITVFLQRRKTQKALKRSDALLLNILPEEIAEELKVNGKADARNFDAVSILFTDFKGFTKASAKLNAQELVAEISTCFEAFDGIMEKYGIEKIKTIGDAYMAAGGLPIPTDDSIKNTVLAALEMQDFIVQRHQIKVNKGEAAFEMRVGIHTGPVVAGIVGVKKFQYDIWGDTVNTASRVENHGDVGKVNISEATYALLKGEPDLVFEERGKISVKGKGEMTMYYVSQA